MKFQYILDKINATPISSDPFSHLYIDNVFDDNDFQEIIKSQDIKIDPAVDDKELFDSLFANGYRIVEFPGCTENYKEYIAWHKEKQISKKTNSSCEGFGVVLRQENPKTNIIKELDSFLNSQSFIECISQKFDIYSGDCNYDCGIQKYLDGYEISPHPDVRRKALTYMVNINPDENSHNLNHHTHYLKFKNEFDYVRVYWEGNKEIDTCWVPWSWCATCSRQTENNSLVIFSPSSDTLHGVKANYNHLNNQRTQLYGNLWYKNNPARALGNKWEGLQLNNKSIYLFQKGGAVVGRALNKIANKFKKKSSKKSSGTHSDRSY